MLCAPRVPLVVAPYERLRPRFLPPFLPAIFAALEPFLNAPALLPRFFRPFLGAMSGRASFR